MQISATNTSLTYSIQQDPLGVSDALNKSRTQNTEGENNTRATHTAETGDARQQSQDQGLSEEEKQQVAQLQKRDREVRAHEAAHIAASGGLAGGASFSFQTGPDGRTYAVGGEVSIDTSAVKNDPQATIQKARTIRAAALAPAQPSGADQAVAAAATKMESAARVELAAQDAEEQQTSDESSTTTETSEPSGETRESSKTDLSLSNTDSEANQYRDTANPNAPSDLVGQLLNTSA